MATRIASLFAEIGADTSGLERGLKDTERQLKQTGRTADQAGQEIKRGLDMGPLADGMVAVGAGLGAITAGVLAAKKVMDFAEEGAEVRYLEQRFGRLSAEVETTAFVFENKLLQATQGLLSETGAMGLATDVLSLGLVKSEEDAIRLARATAELNFDLNQLSLTLANKTTMRFDQLGVSIDGFDEKLAELEAAGMSTEEAFTEAFLQQAEKQIERVGSATGTASGQIRALNAELETFRKNRLAAFAESGIVGTFVQGTTARIQAINTLTRAREENILTEEEYLQLLRRVNLTNAEAANVTAEVQTEINRYTRALEEAADADRILKQQLGIPVPPIPVPVGITEYADQTSAILQHLEDIQLLSQGGIVGGDALTESLDLTAFDGVEAKLAGLVSGETLNVEGGIGALSTIESKVGDISRATEGVKGMGFDEDLKVAQDISAELDAMDGRTINIDIVYHGNLPEFHSGGIVPGPIGQPTPIMALGGETVQPINQTTNNLNMGGVNINNGITQRSFDQMIRRWLGA